MKNKAKCKLCLSIIESYHSTDYVECKCGEICVDKGDAMHCAAKNWLNFVRVDDEGKEVEIVVKGVISEDDIEKETELSTKPTRDDLIEMLDEMIKSIEILPDHAKLSSINHYDYCALMMLLAQIFKHKD